MATEIGSLLIDMRADVARLSQDMARAQSTVEGAMKNVQRSAAAAVTALGLIGVGVSVAGMANVVKGAVGAMAALDDMAAKAGTTVENMSALVDVAKIGGHDIGVMEGAMVRLTKALAGGDEEAKGAGKALATLGLNAEKLRGMDTAEAMLEVALALDQYGNGSGKTALALDLLGKSGAAALPFLEDLAETGRLNATVTTEQAAAAERLEKDINAVKIEGERATRAMVAGLLPAMGDIAKAMRLAAEEGGTLKALFVGFGGLADEFAKPWKAVFLSIGASFNEMLATLEEGLAKVTFGGVSDRHRMSALGHRDAAREMNLQIAALDNRRGSAAAGDAKPQLDYVGGGSGGKAGKSGRAFDPDADFDLKFATMNEKAKRAGFDERDKAAEAEATALDKLREKYIGMADPLQQYRVQLDEINNLRAKGLLSTDQALEAEWAVNEAMDKAFDKMTNIGEAMKENGNFARDMGLSFTSAFEDAVVGGKKASDVIRSLGQDIARIIMRKSITEPFGNTVSEFVKKIDFGNLFKAEGGPVTGGQSYIVGERGPELFTPGASGAITPNHQLAAGGTSNHFTVDMRGASVEAVVRLEQLVMSVNGSIERRALNVIGQARVRGA
jgi:hypothetical protein